MNAAELGVVAIRNALQPTVSAGEGESFVVDIYARELRYVHPGGGTFIATGVRFKRSTLPKGTRVEYQCPLDDPEGRVTGGATLNKGEVEVFIRNDKATELVIINRGMHIARIVIGG